MIEKQLKGRILSDEEINNRLNELYDENERLKSELQYWSTTAKARKKEIDRLKNKISNLLNKTWEQRLRFEKYNQELMIENEELKQDLEEYVKRQMEEILND